MHKHIILVAETGCDIPAALAVEKDIFLVPMHVQMGDVTLEDGSFPPEDVCAYYDRTGKCATTSASSTWRPTAFHMVSLSRMPAIMPVS